MTTATLPALNIGSLAPLDTASAFDLPQILQRGGDSLGRWIKKIGIGLVSLQTRLEDYPLAVVIRNDETNYIRVGVFTRPMRDGFEFCYRGEWQIVKIPRTSIVKIETRS